MKNSIHSEPNTFNHRNLGEQSRWRYTQIDSKQSYQGTQHTRLVGLTCAWVVGSETHPPSKQQLTDPAPLFCSPGSGSGSVVRLGGAGGGPKAVSEGGGGNRGMPRRTRQNGALSTGHLATLCPYGEPVPREIWWPLFRWVP